MYEIADIFIQSTSGIPYISRCYGAQECIQNPNHTLLTGFFAALSSFKEELKQDKLKIVGFTDISLLFESNQDIIIIIGVNTNKYDEEIIHALGCEIRNKFYSEYGEILENQRIVNSNIFDDFINWLDNRVNCDNAENLELFDNKSIWQKIKSLL